MAPTALPGFLERIQHVPVPEDLLKEIRTALIRKTKTNSFEEAESESENLASLFSLILQTAEIPSLSQQHRALASDAISTWLIRSAHSNLLRRSVEGVPEVWDSLTNVAFAHFDEANSALSKALKDLLGNILSSTREFGFKQRLAERALAASGKKVGYYVFEVLLRQGVGAEWVLSEHHGIVQEMLLALRDRTLSPVIGKAVVGLLAAIKAEVQDLQCWMGYWQDPLSKALKSEEVRGNVQVYALPGLFRLSPDCFVKFIQGLGLARYNQGGVGNGDEMDLMSLLCCLKVGRDLGFVDEINDTSAKDNNAFPLGIPIQLPSSFISPLLSHAHEHIRLAALTLTTYSQTPTKPLPSSTFRVLKYALPPLHAETDAEVRNQIIRCIRQLVERLGSSSYALDKDLRGLEKNASRLSNDQTIPPTVRVLEQKVGEAGSFIRWYLQFLKAQLAPGSNYQRAVTALRVLRMITHSGADPSLVNPNDEAGKKKGLLKWPQGVQVNVFDKGMKRVLLDCLFNPFDDVRAMAAEVLKTSPDCGGALRTVLERGLEEMNVSGRASDADGVARSIELWFHFAVKKSPEASLERVWGLQVAAGDDKLYIFDWVIDVLELDYLKVAREDFQKAVRERPVHGLMAGLRLIFERKGVYERNFESREGKQIISRILEYCADIWRMSKDILCYASPEGYVPGEMMDGETEGEDEMGTQTVMSYCWRAVKESSALLGTIISTATFDDTPKSLLTKKDFSNAGNLLLEQLSDIRHRGAFSAVSPGFISLCSRCLASPPLSDLPKEWLSRAVLQITGKSNSITRRSAGLPSLIVGIVIADPDPNCPLLKSTFSQLEDLARLPAMMAKDGTKVNLPQVHALNCLKVMFTDSRLSSPSQGLLGRGLELAVGCFASEVWAIRNCGIMLFTALVNRLFGKRMTGTVGIGEFLGRYPGVARVLLESMNEGSTEGVEQLYPALSLIARLEPSEGFDVSGVEPAVVRCLSSRIWKIREMAARSYSTLVGAGEMVEVIDRLLRNAAESKKQNFVHGRLCAVKALLDRRGSRDRENIPGTLGRYWEVLLRSNKCAVTKALFLSLINDEAVRGWLSTQPHDQDAQNFYNNLLSYCETSKEVLQEVTLASTVGRSMLKEQLARHISNLAAYSKDFTATFADLISSEDEELALYTSTYLLSSPITFDQETLIELDVSLWTLITNHPWDQLRAVAINLVSKYPPPQAAPTRTLRERYSALLTLCTSAATEPCRIAALPALATLTTCLCHRLSTPLDELTKQVKISAHEDNPFPTRRAAVSAIEALSPILTFDKFDDVYFCLYDFLHDDDEDIRDAAAVVIKLVTKGEHTMLPLAAADVLVKKMVSFFSGDENFFREVASRVVITRDVKEQLMEACTRDKILFAREKQNLFLGVHGEMVRWAGVLGGFPERGEFVKATLDALASLREFVEEMGAEGPIGWMSEEDAWVVLGRVVEGLGVIKRWRGKGSFIEEAVRLLEAIRGVGGHEIFAERLEEVVQG